MALPILVVVGATGAQGSGVVSAFTSSDEKPRYQIRALTSNTSSPSAVELAAKANVTVAHVDLSSFDSVLAAFKDAKAIFANAVFHVETALTQGPAAAQQREERQGLNIARAASQIKSLKHLVWSTLPDALAITDGKYNIANFQAKIPAEKFLQSPESGLAEKTTFLRVGMYGSNVKMPVYQPISVEFARKHVMVFPCSPTVKMPFTGDESLNTGLIVRAIFSQPDKTLGRYVSGHSEMLSCQEWAATLTKALEHQGKKGVEVIFMECTLEAWGTLWGPVGMVLGTMFRYFDEFGPASYEKGTGGAPLVTPKDLGVDGKLRSTEERLSMMKWPFAG